MILKESKLKVVDNSGGLVVKCFHIFKKKYGTLGCVLMVSIQTFRRGRKVKKGEVYRGILVHLRSIHKRDGNFFHKFDFNGVVLWKRKEEAPLGSRIKFKVPLELRFLGFLKIVLISLGTY